MIDTTVSTPMGAGVVANCNETMFTTNDAGCIVNITVSAPKGARLIVDTMLPMGAGSFVNTWVSTPRDVGPIVNTTVSTVKGARCLASTTVSTPIDA